MAKKKKKNQKNVALSNDEIMGLMKTEEQTPEPLPTNVIAFAPKKKQTETKNVFSSTTFSFDDIIAKNNLNKKRIKEEQEKHNKWVVRSKNLK